MLVRKIVYTGVVAIGFVASSASAGWFDDIVTVVTAPVRVPAEATIDVLTGRDPARSAREAAEAAGRTTENGVNVTQRITDQINSVPREAIARNFGRDWENAYDILTASQRVQTEMSFTGGRFLGQCFQFNNCNLNNLLAMPVAASLRDAYKLYIPYGQPLDPGTYSVLSRVVPNYILNDLRIVYSDTPNLSIPGFLNSGHETFHQGHAVTIGNLIIFSRPLDSRNLNDWNWLLHEIRHSEQYRSYSGDIFESIDGFSGDYVVNFNGMENDAQNRANYWQGQLDQICRFGC